MNRIVIHQSKNKFYNADMISFVNMDNGGITLHVNNGEVDFGRYKDASRKQKAFEMLQDFLSGRFVMPKEEDLEYINDFVFVCPECGCKNKITMETLSKLSNRTLKPGAATPDPTFFCSACGNKFSLHQFM